MPNHSLQPNALIPTQTQSCPCLFLQDLFLVRYLVSAFKCSSPLLSPVSVSSPQALTRPGGAGNCRGARLVDRLDSVCRFDRSVRLTSSDGRGLFNPLTPAVPGCAFHARRLECGDNVTISCDYLMDGRWRKRENAGREQSEPVSAQGLLPLFRLQIHHAGVNVYVDQRLKELGLDCIRKVLGFRYCIGCSLFDCKFFTVK